MSMHSMDTFMLLKQRRTVQDEITIWLLGSEWIELHVFTGPFLFILSQVTTNFRRMTSLFNSLKNKSSFGSDVNVAPF